MGGATVGWTFCACLAHQSGGSAAGGIAVEASAANRVRREVAVEGKKEPGRPDVLGWRPTARSHPLRGTSQAASFGAYLARLLFWLMAARG